MTRKVARGDVQPVPPAPSSANFYVNIPEGYEMGGSVCVLRDGEVHEVLESSKDVAELARKYAGRTDIAILWDMIRKE